MQNDNDWDTQISNGPDTQYLMELIQYRFDRLASLSPGPDDEPSNHDDTPFPIIDSQFTSGYDPSKPYRPAWAPTPYKRLVPTSLPVPVVPEPAKKDALIKEGTADAYLTLYKRGELEARVDERGSWELHCFADCWVRTGISARIPLTTKGQFSALEAHARGKSCKANAQKSAIQESRVARATMFTPGPLALSAPLNYLSSLSPSTRKCPGFKITDWPTTPDTPICTTFPWLRMRDGPDKLVFDVEFTSQTLFARSHDCLGALEQDTPFDSCYHCSALSPKIVLLAKNADGFSIFTRHNLLTPIQLLEVIKRLEEQVNELKLQGVNDSRTIRHLLDTLSDNSALVMALSQQDVPYLRQLLHTSLKNGASIKTILRTLEHALEHGYRPRRHKQESLDLAALIYRLGGRNLLFAITQRFPLPSLRTLRNRTSFVKIVPAVGRISSQPIAENLKNLLIDSRDANSSRRGVSILIDETALEEAAVYFPDLNAVGGLCWLHAHTVDITLNSYQSALNITEALKDGKVHLAKEITVVVARLFGEDSVYPLLAAPTCKSEQACDMEFVITTIINTFTSTGAVDTVGPLWSIATDGDATRRKACHRLLVREKLTINHPIYGILSNLPGLNLYTGPSLITLDPDFKHNIKRCSTSLRSRSGIYINSGHCINTFMLERYLTWVDGVDEGMARRLLCPDDPQDVPRAVELLTAVKKLGRLDLCTLQTGLFDIPFDANTVADFDALIILSHVYESLIEPYVDINMSLSQQIVSLSRLAHLLFTLYRDQGRRFIPNPLYYDLQSMIKSVMFNVAKQQKLDPTAPYAIIENGDDALEGLFAFLRMSGGHHSALNHREAIDRLGAARDIADIFSRNPDLNSGHRRLNLKRKESVDHISRSHWVGDLTSGHCDLPTCWREGRDEAESILLMSKVLPSHYNFSSLFSDNSGTDLLRPLGGNKYPSIDDSDDLGVNDEETLVDMTAPACHSAPALDSEGTTGVTLHQLNTDLQVIEDPDLELSFEDALCNSLRDLEIGSAVDKDHEDDEELVPSFEAGLGCPPKGPGIHPADYLWCEQRWVHKQSVCRIIISPNFTPKSRDRLMRVRGFTAVNKYSDSFSSDTSRVLHGEQFIVGDIFLSFLRTHDKQLALGLLRATGIQENGTARANLHKATVTSSRGNVKVAGDLMILLPSQKSASELTWVWNGGFSNVMTSAPGSSLANDRVVSVSVLGQLIEPINPPVLNASEHLLPGDLLQVNSKGTTWAIKDDTLKTVVSMLWKKVLESKIVLTAIPILSGPSSTFPYRALDGMSSLICLAGTEQLNAVRGKGAATSCIICGETTKDIRSHMGMHILRAARGVSERGEVMERITGTLPCGFCGRTGELCCSITMKELSRSTQWNTNCPKKETFQYASASKGSENRPCRNVPIVCKLCTHEGRETDTRPAIWRYNMEAHLDYYHPEYSHPGKPAGLPLPRDVYQSIVLTDAEQNLANVTPRPLFTNIQEKENTPVAGTNPRAKKRKQDAQTFTSAATLAKRGRNT